MKIKSKFSFWAVMMGLMWPSVNCMNSDNVGEHNQQSVLLGFTVLNEADDPGSEQDLQKTDANEQQSPASEDRIDWEEIIKNMIEDPTPVISEYELMVGKQAIAGGREFVTSEMEKLQREMDDCSADINKMKPYFSGIYNPEAMKKGQQTLSKMLEINLKMKSLRNIWDELCQYE